MSNVENKMSAKFNFVGFSNEDIEWDVQTILSEDLEFEITVTPKNGMVAIFDFQEAETTVVELDSVKDSYITSNPPYNSINRGEARSMVVGVDDKGDNRGLIQFDLSELGSELYLSKSYLRIYYDAILEDASFDLYTVDGDWSEYGVTYLNRPNLKSLISKEYTINREDAYIEFDVTQIVNQWYRGIKNDGFYLTSNNISTIFKTKESDFKPTLIVEYKDITKKASSSNSQFEINVRGIKEEDLEFSVEVGEYYSTNDIEFEVFAHRPDDFYSNDIEFEIESLEIMPQESLEDIEWDVTNYLNDFRQISWDITVSAYEDNDDIEFELEIPVVYNEDSNSIEFEVNLGLNGNDEDIEFEVNIVGSYIEEYDDVEFEVDAEAIPVKYAQDYIEFEISSTGENKEDIVFDIIVNSYNDTANIEFEIGVIGYLTEDIEFEISLPLSNIEFEVSPLFNAYEDIEFEVLPRVIYVSDLEFEIVSRIRGNYSYAFII